MAGEISHSLVVAWPVGATQPKAVQRHLTIDCGGSRGSPSRDRRMTNRGAYSRRERMAWDNRSINDTATTMTMAIAATWP
jgi:hypothetical protein